MMQRFLAAGMILAILALTLDASAKPGVLKTKDGRTIEGDIVDKGADGATITTKGGAITIARDDIDAITYGGGVDIQKEYEARKAKIPADAGARAHYELARWLYDNRAYDLARAEINTTLAKDPNHVDAATLRATIERQAALERRGPAANGGRPAGAQPPNTGTRPARPDERPTLNAEQINIIRQNELKEGDRVNVAFTGDVKRKFVEYDNRQPRDFNALAPLDQALAILQLGTPEMRKHVRITNDPPALAEYKTRIQPTLLIGCAAANCHGGNKGGALQLITPAQNDAATYTNFFILSQLEAPSEGATRKVIDRLYPMNSLAIQYGLPRDTADFDHPDVPGWAPIYRNLDDPKLRLLTDWAQNRLVAVEPNYKDLLQAFPLPTPKEVPPPTPADPQSTPATDQPREQPRNQPGNQQGNNERRGNTTRDALDEARQRIRPTGGAGNVPGL